MKKVKEGGTVADTFLVVSFQHFQRAPSGFVTVEVTAVSYTHLDVYKRQAQGKTKAVFHNPYHKRRIPSATNVLACRGYGERG